MIRRHDLSSLSWTLTGWTPYLWRLAHTMELSESPAAECPAIPARVPGSVQQSLRNRGLLPDWRLPGNDRQCEWVENRHWVFETTLPDAWFVDDGYRRLRCEGLDYAGWIFLNGQEVGTFTGTHVPHTVDVTAYAQPTGNRLQIVFDLPPRWLGQFGYTSQMQTSKPRFNYLWDWTHRLVQIGIWDHIVLEITDGLDVTALRCLADADPVAGTGILRVDGNTTGGENHRVHIALKNEEKVVRETTMSAPAFAAEGVHWNDLRVALWWPNGEGAQPLYTVTATLLDASGRTCDLKTRRVGFRHIEWRQCEGAPTGADPWLCVINGRPVFLQGVNWNPLLPNFADVSADDYRRKVALYTDLGINTIRVWGGGVLEKEVFYDLCDTHGILVWQDMVLSSSGVENVPPADAASIEAVGEILRSFIARRQHHAALLLWCGGNELHEVAPEGYGRPLTTAHPLLRHLEEVVKTHDPGRRFVPTSATGPRFYANPNDVGKGILGNVHGPWKLWSSMEEWKDYWARDDALFRAETGAPGAAPVAIVRRYAGDREPMPVTAANPVWRRPLTWWIEDGAFRTEHGRDPRDLDDYVTWSQARQAEALTVAVRACKDRFPRMGGILLWCGHDCCPCPANTSIVDFHNTPKPAALALKKIWKNNS